MNEIPVYSIPLDEQYINISRGALSMFTFLMHDLTTDFSLCVYKCNCADLDELDALLKRFKKATNGDLFPVTETELVIIYTANYIACCFMQNKEAFYKWFLEYETGMHGDSNDIRCVLQNAQMAAAFVIHNSGLCEAAIEKRRTKLINCFGILKDSFGNETIV